MVEITRVVSQGQNDPGSTATATFTEASGLAVAATAAPKSAAPAVNGVGLTVPSNTRTGCSVWSVRRLR